MLARNLSRSLPSRASGSITFLRSTRAAAAPSAPFALSHSSNAALLARPCAAGAAAPLYSAVRHGLHTTAVVRKSNDSTKKDRSWVEKGEVKYSELKPETQAPSGKITIIDVREPDEVAQGIIPSAVNVPLSQLQTAFSGTGTGGNFVQDFGFERPEFDDKLIFYCRSGKRSQQALEYAQAQGWWNSRNYTGSWLDWTAHEEKK